MNASLDKSGRGLRIAGAVAALAALVVTSTWTVAQDEQGVVLRFGRVARRVPPGMHFTLPWPIERLVAVSTTEVRSLEIGFVREERERGLAPTSRESQWLSGDTNIVSAQATVNYTVADPVAYLFGVSDDLDGGSRDLALQRSVEAALTAHLARKPIDEVLASGKAVLAREVREAAQREVDALGLGLRVGAVNLVAIEPPAQVITAFNDVSSAKSDSERRVTEAEGYAARIQPRARAVAARIESEALADKSQRVARARGEASRFLELEVRVREDPGPAMRRIWLETVERVLTRGTLRVVQPPEGSSRRRVWLRR